MKTIFAILLGFFFTATLFASDRRPTVTLNGNSNYEVVIDGHRYSGNNNSINLSNLRNGRHTIEVYEFRRGLFKTNRRLISSRDFRLRDNDLSINVDRYGEVQIYETRNDRGRDDDRNNGWGRDDDWKNKKDGKARDKDWNHRKNHGKGRNKHCNDSNHDRNEDD